MANFRLEGPRAAAVELNNTTIRAATGSMVAYDGDISFKHAGLGGGDGIRASLKRRVAGETLTFMECSGRGTLYLAVAAHEVTFIQLSGQTLSVESDSLLAVDNGLKTDMKFAGVRGATTGQGLFTTTVTGHGTVAILSDGPAIMLEVSAQYPLVVDPQAYVASYGQLTQSFVTDVSWRNFVGEGSGEAFSLRFEGSGVVYIQPTER